MFETTPSGVVTESPERVYELIAGAKPDVVVGPSGYGLAFKHLSDVPDRDLALTTLEKKPTQAFLCFRGLEGF